MPFTYQTYQPQFAGSIADLMVAQGQTRAHALQQAAALQAQAEEAKAAGRAGMVNAIGGAVTGTIGDVMRNRQAQALAARQAQIDAQKADDAQLDRTVKRRALEEKDDAAAKAQRLQQAEDQANALVSDGSATMQTLAPLVGPVKARQMLDAMTPAKKAPLHVGDALLDPDSLQPVYTAPAKQEKPPNVQSEDFLLDGKRVKGTFDPSGTGRYLYNGQDVTARVQAIPPASASSGRMTDAPGDWDKTGDDFLQSIPKQWRKTVEKIAHYDEDPTKVASMRGGNRETMMQWVNQVNPGYDSTLFGNRAPTRKAFTTGTQGQQINAINTAIGHIDQITGLAAQLGNSNTVPVNQWRNIGKTMFGSDSVTNFDTLKDALAGEVAGVMAKGGATVSGIAEAKQKINASNSPQQLAGYVKTLIPLMGSKLTALDYQYHQAMGPDDSYSALSPDSKRILAKFGFDPAQHSGGGAATQSIGRFQVEVTP
jgi:hypothetical protein